MYYKNNKCFNDYEVINEKIKYICNAEWKYFFNKPNVVGIGLGHKIKNGFETCEKCIKVFVTKKISSNELSIKDLVPLNYKGVKTDVVQSGNFQCDSLTKRVRPIYGGYSMGPSSKTQILPGGTMGCLVKDNNKNIYMLGNNHVFALENRLPIGTIIVQPSASDGGRQPKDIVGTLNKYIHLNFSSGICKNKNYVDCAIVKPTKPSIVSPKIALFGTPKGIMKPFVTQSVTKVGKNTELTIGKVVSTCSTITVGYSTGNILLINQIITSKMSMGGDSGSLLMNSDGYAVGLIAGSSPSMSFANDIKNVLNSLKVTLVTN